MVHVEPRFTKDLDVFLAADSDNVSKFCSAMSEFGFPLSDEAGRELTQPNRMISIGHPPSRIDVLNELTGMAFESAWPGRVSVNVEGVSLSVIGLKELIQAKRASGRPQDLIDVADLERAQKSE
jgi:hypothetical protein